MANLILWTCMNIDHAPIRTLAAYQLASWIRKHGYTVKVIDFCHRMTTDELINITEKHVGSDTIAIGVSSTFWGKGLGVRFDPEPRWVVDARLRLKDRVKVPWLLGGYGSTSPNLSLDWVKFYSNSEDSLLKWLDENSGKLKRRNLFDIKTLEKNFMVDDFVQPFEVVPIELGRGCQFKCRFCSYPLIGKKKGTYLRDFDYLKNEFIQNFEEHGITKYYFQDDTVNESEEKVRALADIAQALPFELQWSGYNRLDLIHSRPGTSLMLKDSGLKSAYFGIESFHPTAAMAVGKGWNGKYAKDYILQLKKEWGNNVSFFLSFIIGLPGEDKTSIELSHQWCIDNDMYEWLFISLSIQRNENKLWRSEFDIEYEKWGYSFPYGDFFNWKNEFWTKRETVEYARDLFSRIGQIAKPSGYFLTELVGLGYTYEELMHKKKIDIDWQDVLNRANSIMRNYIEYQLK